MPSIETYGSSTPGGMGDDEMGGWPNRMRVIFNQRARAERMRSQPIVVSRAVPGELISVSLRKLEQDVELYGTDNQYRIILLQPTYDSTIDLTTGENKTNPKLYESKLRSFCTLALHKKVSGKRRGEPYSELAIVGSPPLAGNAVNFYDMEEYVEAERCKYETINRTVAGDYGIRHFDVWGLCGGSTAIEDGMVAYDDIHSSALAHEKITEDLLVYFVDPLLAARWAMIQARRGLLAQEQQPGPATIVLP